MADLNQRIVDTLARAFETAQPIASQPLLFRAAIAVWARLR
ncbi:hypothetical protein [Mesorhizobium sp. M0027]